MTWKSDLITHRWNYTYIESICTERPNTTNSRLEPVLNLVRLLAGGDDHEKAKKAKNSRTQQEFETQKDWVWIIDNVASQVTVHWTVKAISKPESFVQGHSGVMELWSSIQRWLAWPLRKKAEKKVKNGKSAWYGIRTRNLLGVSSAA